MHACASPIALDSYESRETHTAAGGHEGAPAVWAAWVSRMHHGRESSAVQCGDCEPGGETGGAATHGGARFAGSDGVEGHVRDGYGYGCGCGFGCGVVACEPAGQFGSGVAVGRTVAGTQASGLERRRRLQVHGATGELLA